MPAKTAVCVLRVEDRGPGEVLITVTTTPDVVTVPRGRARSVVSYDEAMRLVARFLRECAAARSREP